MPKLYWHVDQGSAQWYQLRATIPTASEFHNVITPAKMQLSTARFKYAARIIAARLLNWQADSLDKIAHIQDGKEKEPLAVAQMELLFDIETRPLGFATTDDGRFGASPDRVVIDGDRVVVTAEAKCPTVPIQMERVLAKRFAELEAIRTGKEYKEPEDDYKCQRLGQLYVTEADKAIYLSFHERFPEPYFVETGRDEAAIKIIADGLERFSDELEDLTETARSLGIYQAFEYILPPLDASLQENDEAALADIIEGRLDDRLSWAG